jgi:flavin-dependent thymidylate synthase
VKRDEYRQDNDPFNEVPGTALVHPDCAMKNEIHAPHNWQADQFAPMNYCAGVADQDAYDNGNGMEVSQGAKWEDPELTHMKGAINADDVGEPPMDETLHEGNQPKPTQQIVRWADRAMFKAEPIDADEGPQVYLLWMTPDPLGAIAAACKMYKGEVVRDLATVTDDERLEYFQQVQKTKLKAPFEFVKFHFIVEGVTRAFTHQMVRQRAAVYAQESLRFAVLGGADEGIPVRLPPSLSGLPEDNHERIVWEDAMGTIESAYLTLVENGVPAEDARGLLPHNVLTRLHYSTDLRALLDHAGNRLCTQAQFEWRLVFAKIVEEIRSLDINVNDRSGSNPADANGIDAVYMARELTDLFKPVCYQTGKCEFKANFDRSCSIRERVDANAEIGRSSSEWGEWFHADGGSGKPSVGPIKPGEWLLDHNAARRK